MYHTLCQYTQMQMNTDTLVFGYFTPRSPLFWGEFVHALGAWTPLGRCLCRDRDKEKFHLSARQVTVSD